MHNFLHVALFWDLKVFNFGDFVFAIPKVAGVSGREAARESLCFE